MFFHHEDKKKNTQKQEDPMLKFIETLKPEVENVPTQLPEPEEEQTTPTQPQQTEKEIPSPNVNVQPEPSNIMETPEMVEKPTLFIHIDDYEELRELLDKLIDNLKEMNNLLSSYKQLHDKESELLDEWATKIDDNKDKVARILEILNVKAF